MRDEENVENVTIPCPPGFQLAAHPPTKPANLGQYVNPLDPHGARCINIAYRAGYVAGSLNFLLTPRKPLCTISFLRRKTGPSAP